MSDTSSDNEIHIGIFQVSGIPDRKEVPLYVLDAIFHLPFAFRVGFAA